MDGTLTFNESRFSSPGEVHDFLRGRLAFPSYYGRNFSALSDCLTDICELMRITLVRDGADSTEMKGFFDKLVDVIGRCAQENESIEFCVKYAPRRAGGQAPFAAG